MKTLHNTNISVVVPLYNKERQIARALASVRSQTVDNFEIIVVDDGSRDRSAEIVAGISDSRIRLYQQENGGVSAARNRGVELARSNIVAFLDGDDAWHPTHLQQILNLRASFPIAVAWANNYEIVKTNGETTLGVRDSGISRTLLTPENFFRIARRGTPVFSSAVAVDREIIKKAGGFPIGVRLGEDLDTWIRLLFIGPIAFDANPTAFYHADGDDRAMVRNPPPQRYVFFDTDESWIRANPQATRVAYDIEAFHDFFRLVYAHHQIKWGNKSAGRQALMSLKTEEFSAERDRLWRISMIPQRLYRALSQFRSSMQFSVAAAQPTKRKQA